MIDGQSLQSLNVNIISTARVKVGTEWNYADVYGPFHDLHLVHDGHATVRHHKQDFHLNPGVLHFAPGYTRASSKCESFIDHSYIYFACKLPDCFENLLT